MATARIDGVADEIGIGKIICVGKNYEAHAREMGGETLETPVLFLKPSTAVIDEDEPIRLPAFSREVHHEVEMVVLIGMEGRFIPRADALDYVAGYGIGLDLTARDVQNEAKKKGLPWTVSKGFDGSAPLSRFVRAELVPDPSGLSVSLTVNGEVRQSSTTSLMIHRVEDLIAYASTIFTLCPGDLLFTGTPEGVGPIHPGDRLELALGTLVTASFEVAEARSE